MADDYTVIATGPAPPSRAAQIGGAFGQGLGVGAGALFADWLGTRRKAKQLNPLREALEQTVLQMQQSGVPLNPVQQQIAAVVSDPKAYARLAGSPEGSLQLAQQFQQQSKPAYYREVVVRGGSDLNEKLGLGLLEGESATVKLAFDANDHRLPGFELSDLHRPSTTTKGLQRVSAVVRGEQEPSTLMFDPETGTFERTHADGRRERIASADITQVALTGGREQVLPPARADDLVAQLDWLNFQQEELGAMLTALQSDPTLAGTGGAIRRFVQQAIGITDDLGRLFGEAGAQRASQMVMSAERAALSEVERGSMDEATYNRLFNDPKLSEIQLFENTLAYTLARLRVPEGRLLASVINDSRKDAKLVGLTSSQDVQNRLAAVQRQLEARTASIQRRLGGAPRVVPNTGDLPPAATYRPMTIEEALRHYDPDGVEE